MVSKKPGSSGLSSRFPLRVSEPGEVVRRGPVFRHQVGQVVASQGGKEVLGQQAIIEVDSLVNFCCRS